MVPMIYHYTSGDSLFGIIDSKKFWLTSLNEISDKADRVYSILFSCLAFYSSNNEVAKNIINHISKENFLTTICGLLNLPLYSLSFGDKNDSGELWPQYARPKENDKRRFGCCIEVNDEILKDYINNLNLNNSTPFMISKIIYGYPIDDFEEMIGKVFSQSAIDTSEDYLMNTLKNIICIIEGNYKGLKFVDEHETRLLYHDYLDENFQKFHAYFNVSDIEEKLKDYVAIKKAGSQEGIKASRCELDVSEIFNSQLIPRIIVKDINENDLSELKSKLKASGLIETKVIDLKEISKNQEGD